jgi:hypothetical protein
MMGLLGFANDCSTCGASTGSLLAPNNQEKKREKEQKQPTNGTRLVHEKQGLLPLAPGSSRVCRPSFLLSCPGAPGQFSVVLGKIKNPAGKIDQRDEAAPRRPSSCSCGKKISKRQKSPAFVPFPAGGAKGKNLLEKAKERLSSPSPSGCRLSARE